MEDVAIIDNIASGNIDGEIVVVISNKPNVMGIKRAQKAGIPVRVIQHVDYKTREEFEEELTRELEEKMAEIVVLAGFMRILTDHFVRHWRGKLINIHPTLLPSFKGTNGWKQAIDAGVRVSGCTVHFVEVEVDGGAIITQEVVTIKVGETVESLQAKTGKAEQKALPRAVQLLCSEKCHLDLNAGKVVTIEVGETVESLPAKTGKAEQKALPRAVQLFCSEKCHLDLNVVC
uniref:phosphoribosylglycinamide formyltransferase 1 n=1 Tax=Rhodnius prolixus TaxID=13249 RepID=T1HGP5_RHOPR